MRLGYFPLNKQNNNAVKVRLFCILRHVTALRNTIMENSAVYPLAIAAGLRHCNTVVYMFFIIPYHLHRLWLFFHFMPAVLFKNL